MTTLPFEAAEISRRATIQEIVAVYQREIVRIRAAYATLADAGAALTQAFGKETTYSSISALPERCYEADRTRQQVELNIRAACWHNLIDRLGIRRLLSVKRNEELSQRLSEKDKLPEITVQEVYTLFETLTANANDFAREAIVEVYEMLRVHPDWPSGWKYKTNQRHAFEHIGKKVILGGYVEPGYGGGYRINYYRTDRLRALDKVFHTLDSAPFNEAGYLSPLLDAITTSSGTGQTTYFRFKCYQNGNLHLEFLRPDLLKRFNQYAADPHALKSGRVF
jgi:hypothetical protein